MINEGQITLQDVLMAALPGQMYPQKLAFILDCIKDELPDQPKGYNEWMGEDINLKKMVQAIIDNQRKIILIPKEMVVLKE